MPIIPLRHIIDDIVLDLKQSTDDRIIEKAQIGYWVLMVANRLNSQHIAKRSSGQFLTTFADIPVQQFAVNNNPNEIKCRKYITLPKSIYDYDNDAGIEYISYYTEEECDGCPPPFTQNKFTRTTQSNSERLYMNIYECPSPSNPFFYRTGDNIYFLGIEKVDIKKVEIGIYAELDPITTIDIDQSLEFPSELLVILKRQVLDLGRFSLLIPQERVNDGSDNVTPNNVPTQKLVSVNELNQPTEGDKK